jgi:hypothetical protein
MLLKKSTVGAGDRVGWYGLWPKINLLKKSFVGE